LERLRRSKRISKIKNTSTEAFRAPKPPPGFVWVPFTEDSECAQRLFGEVSGVNMYYHVPPVETKKKEEDVAAIEATSDDKAIGTDATEAYEVPAVPVSFDDSGHEPDDDDGEYTKKLASPSLKKVASPLSLPESNDSGCCEDLRTFCMQRSHPKIDLSNLKGSDFPSNSGDYKSGLEKK
jgi:hypothetical protein